MHTLRGMREEIASTQLCTTKSKNMVKRQNNFLSRRDGMSVGITPVSQQPKKTRTVGDSESPQRWSACRTTPTARMPRKGQKKDKACAAVASSPIRDDVGNPDVGVARQVQVGRDEPLPSHHRHLQRPHRSVVSGEERHHSSSTMSKERHSAAKQRRWIGWHD